MDKNETKCYEMFQTLFIKRVGRKTKAPIREQPTGLKPDSQINRLNSVTRLASTFLIN